MSFWTRLWGLDEWAVILWTDGAVEYGRDSRKHNATAVRHWPQYNAATIATGLTKRAAEREADRLNGLNNPVARQSRINDFLEEVGT